MVDSSALYQSELGAWCGNQDGRDRTSDDLPGLVRRIPPPCQGEGRGFESRLGTRWRWTRPRQSVPEVVVDTYFGLDPEVQVARQADGPRSIPRHSSWLNRSAGLRAMGKSERAGSWIWLWRSTRGCRVSGFRVDEPHFSPEARDGRTSSESSRTPEWGDARPGRLPMAQSIDRLIQSSIR
jgi:hypothetical protein